MNIEELMPIIPQNIGGLKMYNVVNVILEFDYMPNHLRWSIAGVEHVFILTAYDPQSVFLEVTSDYKNLLNDEYNICPCLVERDL